VNDGLESIRKETTLL